MNHRRRSICPSCSEKRYLAYSDWCPACGFRTTGTYQEKLAEMSASKTVRTSARSREVVLEEVRQLGFDF